MSEKLKVIEYFDDGTIQIDPPDLMDYIQKELSNYHKEVMEIVGEKSDGGYKVSDERMIRTQGKHFQNGYNTASKEKVEKLKALAKERGI